MTVGEGLSACAANIRAFSSVTAFVLDSTSKIGKLSLTISASVRLQTIMRSKIINSRLFIDFMTIGFMTGIDCLPYLI
jgi:hypothetical protein